MFKGAIASTLALMLGVTAPAAAQVGGTVPTEPFPFAASLQFDAPDFAVSNEHVCGATLVASNWLVTAAHCVTDQPGGSPIPVSARKYHVSVGSTDREAGQRRVVDRIVVHPNWDWFTGTDPVHDIALLHVGKPIALPPAPIARTTPAPGSRITLLGWGKTTPDASGPYPRLMQRVDTVVAPTTSCAPAGITEDETCVDKTPGNGGVCIGDSGGPMVVRGAYGRWELAASASRSHATFCGGTATTSTDHAALRGWTFSVIGHRTA